MWIVLTDSTSSLESAESHRPYRRGSEQLPIVKKSQVLNASFFPGCIEEKSSRPQSGMTLPLFEDQCFHRLISSPEAFLARTLAVQDFAAAWAASGRAYSSILFALRGKQKRQFYSSRMLKASAPSFTLSGLKLKSLAISAGMDLFPPATSEQNTDGNDGSFWPTHIASRAQWQSQKDGSRRLNLPALWRQGKLPTLLARESRSAGHTSDLDRKSPSVSTYWKATTGTNMPISFCEWIMGYSIGATRSEPWATAWYRLKSKPVSESYQALGA